MVRETAATYGGFREGDVVVQKTTLAELHAPQGKGVLLVGDDGVLTICFRAHEGWLDLSGIIEESLAAYYRPATPDERCAILRALAGLSFGTHRGADYFIRWEPKLAAVIKPLIDAAIEEARQAKPRSLSASNHDSSLVGAIYLSGGLIIECAAFFLLQDLTQ